MSTRKLSEGFTCVCRTYHPYSLYVFAHWRETLTHTCETCGAVYTLSMGRATLIENRGGGRT